MIDPDRGLEISKNTSLLMFFNISGFSQNGKIATKYQNKNCGKTSTFQFLQHVVIQIHKSMFCRSFCFDILAACVLIES